MAFKKQKLNSMAASLREAVVDIKHHSRNIPQAVEKIEDVMNELLIEAYISRE